MVCNRQLAYREKKVYYSNLIPYNNMNGLRLGTATTYCVNTQTKCYFWKNKLQPTDLPELHIIKFLFVNQPFYCQLEVKRKGP